MGSHIYTVREWFGTSYLVNQMRVYNREQYLKQVFDFNFLCVIYLESLLLTLSLVFDFSFHIFYETDK